MDVTQRTFQLPRQSCPLGSLIELAGHVAAVAEDDSVTAVAEGITDDVSSHEVPGLCQDVDTVENVGLDGVAPQSKGQVANQIVGSKVQEHSRETIAQGMGGIACGIQSDDVSRDDGELGVEALNAIVEVAGDNVALAWADAANRVRMSAEEHDTVVAVGKGCFLGGVDPYEVFTNGVAACARAFDAVARVAGDDIRVCKSASTDRRKEGVPVQLNSILVGLGGCARGIGSDHASRDDIE